MPIGNPSRMSGTARIALKLPIPTACIARVKPVCKDSKRKLENAKQRPARKIPRTEAPNSRFRRHERSLEQTRECYKRAAEAKAYLSSVVGIPSANE